MPFSIVACVIWYDESPEDLSRMVNSLSGFADGMVALDGAFTAFPVGPDDRPWSPPEQAETLIEGAANAGIELLLYQPKAQGKWPLGYEGNEVEKRNAALRLAGVLNPTWVFNCDADMFLYSAGDARERIQKTRRNVVKTDIEGSLARNHFFRYSPTLEFFKAHWVARDGERLYSGNDKIHDSSLRKRLEPALDLSDVLKFDHPPKSDFWRRARQNQWYVIRDSQGIEAI